MAWIPNVNPNELIESAWGNTIRDHVVNVFATAAERTAAIPTPIEGMVTYRADADVIEMWTGTAWRTSGNVVNTVGAIQPARIRAGTVVGTTDANGLIGMSIAPPIGTGGVIAILGTPSDDQTAFFVMPIRGHFSVGATVAQWHARNEAGGNFANATIRFDYVIVEAL